MLSRANKFLKRSSNFEGDCVGASIFFQQIFFADLKPVRESRVHLNSDFYVSLFSISNECIMYLMYHVHSKHLFI
ncbi:hypothetical protein RIR_jg23768.t1 [Rhizophagus irregularis DAOM 181602=DAOM 197198]|nr:hypothetical protein RIR_jg23768.t1 [Rhizophagus irregularis DAOM 181602=DAOM 197198]